MKKNNKGMRLFGMQVASYQGKYASGTQEKNKPASKPRKRKKEGRKGSVLVLLVPVLAVVVLAAIIPSFLDHSGRVTVQENGWQYYGGSQAPVVAGSQLRQDADGNTHLLNKEEGTDVVTTLPIYIEGASKILLPNEMVYYAPRKGICEKVNLFSTVYCADNGSVQVSNDKKTETVDKGFLYDGGDFYLFLEPVVLEFNGYRKNLPALSYVEACYQGDIMVFNYETKEFLIEPPHGSVIASIETGDYQVSLLNDSMIPSDGSRKLLFTRPDLLNGILD